MGSPFTDRFSPYQVRQLLAPVKLNLAAKKQLLLLTLGAAQKLVYAFLWQEQTFRQATEQKDKERGKAGS
jgi:hypothetical protein